MQKKFEQESFLQRKILISDSMPEPRKWMPGFKKIKPAKPIQKHASLAPIFGNVKPSFFKIKSGGLFAFGSINLTTEIIEPRLARFNPERNRFEEFSSCLLGIENRELIIMNVGNNRSRSGLNVFRLFMNSAITMAKREGVKKIRIKAMEPQVKKYYQKVGFKFESEDPLWGDFILP